MKKFNFNLRDWFRPRVQAQRRSRIPGLKSGKAKQYALLGGCGVALYVGMYLIFSTSGDKPKQQRAEAGKVTTTHINAPGEAVDPRDRWIGSAGVQVAEQGQRLQKQEQATDDLKTKLDNIQRQLSERGMAAQKAVPSVPSAPVAKTETTEKAEKAEKTAGPAAAGETPANPPAAFPPGTPGKTAQSLAQGRSLPPPLPSESFAARPAATIGHFRLEAPAAKEEKPGAKIGGVLGGKKSRSSGKTFLPVGFAKAALLGGIDAPGGGQAQQQPLPVMMRVLDLAVLPNKFRANVRDCFVVGAAYGDISSERAYIRIESLSCIRHDGQALEAKAHGSVYGEDGKLGLRGRLVSKQGQILANALLAGVVSGIGQGIQYKNSNTTVTPWGSTVTSSNNDKDFQTGLAAGFGQAMDRLANYYISLAEKVFPVVEVDSNRIVDIAFTKGIALDTPLPDLDGEDDDENF